LKQIFNDLRGEALQPLQVTSPSCGVYSTYSTLALKFLEIHLFGPIYHSQLVERCFNQFFLRKNEYSTLLCWTNLR